APAPYDLGTLLGDRDTPQVITPAIEEQLLAYYQRGWEQRAGVALDTQDFNDTYFLCALQKALKVVGRFYFLDLVKKKPGYLRYVPAPVRQTPRILPRFPELAEMPTVLLPYLPEGG